MFQTQRYDASGFCYALLMPNGSYTVNLKFADFAATAAGQRVFKVNANGAAAIGSLDVFAEAGGAFKPLTKSFAASVTNGELILDFQGIVNGPIVNGIEILPVGGATTYALSGRVTAGGVGLGGATMTLTGSASGSTATDGSGVIRSPG